MTESDLPRPARRLRGAAGALAAFAVGAGAWVAVPVAAPAADQVTAMKPLAVGLPLAHPVTPVQPAASPAKPVPPRARDPFRPLLTPPEQSVSAPEGAPAVAVPQLGAPAPAPPPAPAPADPPREWTPELPAPGGGRGVDVTVSARSLGLTGVEGPSERLVAVLTIDGRPVRAAVGDSFGPAGQLLLLSLQQGPSDGQWTAVVQLGKGEPFDVVTGTSTRLP
jgi:hypothetical protein